MLLKDLPPSKDPKGGAKTPPGGIPVRNYDEYQTPPYGYPAMKIDGEDSSFWRNLAMTEFGLLAGLVVAWFTAFQGHGVTQKEMEEYVRFNQVDQEKKILTRTEMETYVKQYSPWVFDKEAVINHISNHDQQIGELRTKIDLAGKYFEQQHKP